jgi:hypothetical protein
MKAVITASLRDPEARSYNAADTSSGKPREPVVRLANFLRAFKATSFSARFTASTIPTIRRRASGRRQCDRRRCSTSSTRATRRRTLSRRRRTSTHEDEVGSRSLLPGVSVDTIGGTLDKWFGVSDTPRT